LSNTLKHLKGDVLKTEILTRFKDLLDNTKDAEKLELIIDRFKKSDEYLVLKSAQGVTTKYLKLDTSSIKELDRLIAERYCQLPQTQLSKK